jgi:ubiquinone/menaquinone biosynthesis C-methylase UbiE
LEIQVAGGDTSTPLNLEKRLHLIRDVGGPIPGKRVIDCGCGEGEYVRALREFGASIVGIEFQKSKLLDATNQNSSRPITLSAADIQEMPFRDGAFELALVNEVLEHVPDDLRGLREVNRVLKPGGLVIVFSPNRLYPFETHGVYLKRSGRRVPHYVPGIPYIPLGIGRIWFRYWARNYWPWELKRLVVRAGFEIVCGSFVWQTFENISGHQPRLLGRMSSFLRSSANFLERTPGARSFGVSQMLLARRPAA